MIVAMKMNYSWVLTGGREMREIRKREEEAERKRRAALSDYERRAEDYQAKIERDRFIQRLTGRGRKGKPYTDLAHLPFWDN